MIESKPPETITLISDFDETTKYTPLSYSPTALPGEQVTEDEDVVKRTQNLSGVYSDQYKRDIPVPLVAKHKHPDLSSNDNGEDKKIDGGEEKVELKTENKQELIKQEEIEEMKDLSNSNTPHKATNIISIKHEKPIDDDYKINHGIVQETSTTHPVIRPKPVPVAELFAR